MKARIVETIRGWWLQRDDGIREALTSALQQVETLLNSEDAGRHAYRDPQRLGAALGGFGSDSLDLGALSSLLRQGHDSRAADDQERYQHLRGLQHRLTEAVARIESVPPAPLIQELATVNSNALLDAFDRHMAPLADALGLARAASLETRGQFDPKVHAAVFADFDWRRLSNREMALCPPVVVLAALGGEAGDQLGNLLELARSGRPIKLVILHEFWRSGSEESGRAALRGMNELSLFFLAVRNVYFLQTSIASDTAMHDQITAALESPRAAVISVYADGWERGDFAEHAARALASRAFPHIIYDPERAPDFVNCLDLSANPAPDRQWVEDTLNYVNDEGQQEELQRPLTFADFAAGESEFSDQFSPLDGTANAVPTPLAEYLDLDADEHWRRRPFIFTVDAEQRLARRVPSDAMLVHTVDRMHLWTTLQELSGIANPRVDAAEQQLRAKFAQEKEEALAEQAARLTAQFEKEKEGLLAAAMRQLAGRLVGLSEIPGAEPEIATQSASDATIEAIPITSSPESANVPEQPATAPEGPWIDQRQCTSCDECITINKQLFAYDTNKKAVIRDPRAGPYRDIVKAAEKCASDAIHPGMPLDPSEKDVDRWIKRAQSYR